ncbi:Uncharacterised protein [Bordetella pertussis]|nr:Uncharacterised protein [Bordetella pertussis]
MAWSAPSSKPYTFWSKRRPALLSSCCFWANVRPQKPPAPGSSRNSPRRLESALPSAYQMLLAAPTPPVFKAALATAESWLVRSRPQTPLSGVRR